MANIFQIQSEYVQLMNQLIDNGGEVTPEILEALQINQEQLESKAVNYVTVIRNLEAEADICTQEIKRLQELKKTRENAANRMRDAISNAMKLYEVETIETPTTKISFRKSEAIEIVNENEIPHEFLKVKTEPDKTAIKAAIKSGQSVKGANLVTNKNLQIK
jgi:sucrose-6-phosphate hydrolase SacC (GH32 family)